MATAKFGVFLVWLKAWKNRHIVRIKRNIIFKKDLAKAGTKRLGILLSILKKKDD